MKTLPHPLALRIPPLALTFLAGLAAWFVAHAFPALRLQSTILAPIALALVAVGAGYSLLGVASFRRARTTLNPLQPGAASALVVSGVYRFTRNPMYVGFLFLLLGEIAWLGSPIASIVAPALAAYLHRFQIAPEECALRERFGAEFVSYATRVPRWI